MTNEQTEPCRWVEDEDGDWVTSCGEYFIIINDGRPTGNRMRFCCYCGKPLQEVPAETLSAVSEGESA